LQQREMAGKGPLTKTIVKTLATKGTVLQE
jgi:hypothetical protein